MIGYCHKKKSPTEYEWREKRTSFKLDSIPDHKLCVIWWNHEKYGKQDSYFMLESIISHSIVASLPHHKAPFIAKDENTYTL